MQYAPVYYGLSGLSGLAERLWETPLQKRKIMVFSSVHMWHVLCVKCFCCVWFSGQRRATYACMLSVKPMLINVCANIYFAGIIMMRLGTNWCRSGFMLFNNVWGQSDIRDGGCSNGWRQANEGSRISVGHLLRTCYRYWRKLLNENSSKFMSLIILWRILANLW